MFSVLVFFLVLILISILGIKYKIPPYFNLVGGAMVFGILMGTDPNTLIDQITKGTTSIFYSLGIPILAGSVIAKCLATQGYIEQIIYDLRRFIKSPSIISAFSGFFLGVPSTCPITAFMILSPVTSQFTLDKKRQHLLLYLVAIGSAIGVAYVYPTPVTYSLFDAFSTDLSPLFFDIIAIPLSLLFTGLAIYFMIGRSSDTFDTPDQISSRHKSQSFHPKAWAPFIAIGISIIIGSFILHLSHFGLLLFIMLTGMVTAILVTSHANRWAGFTLGAKHAGVIIFDICGAGALGYVIVSSSFAEDALLLISQSPMIPIMLTPFILAAMIQTAQGSRIVTASTTAMLLAGTSIPALMNPLALFLFIIAGAGVMCFVTDPYFWLLHRETGDEVKKIFTYYTLPQILIGITTCILAVIIQVLFPVSLI